MKPRLHPCYAMGMLVALGSALLAAGLLWAQAGSQRSQAPPPQQKPEKSSKRIFAGKITLVSSRQETETAGAGFKGVGEDGQVQKAVLGTQPDSGANQKVTQLAALQVTAEELAAFLQQGSLRSQSGRRGGGR